MFEPTLVLNLLRGLNERYANIVDHIAATNLTFYMRDQLILKELRLANGVKVAAGTTLLAGFSSACIGLVASPSVGASISSSRCATMGNGGTRRRATRNPTVEAAVAIAQAAAITTNHPSHLGCGCACPQAARRPVWFPCWSAWRRTAFAPQPGSLGYAPGQAHTAFASSS
jgi:hypothetical protein